MTKVSAVVAYIDTHASCVQQEASSIPAVSATSGMSSLQNPVSASLSMPHPSTNQEPVLVPDSTTAQDFKPMVNGPTQTLRPGLVAGNANLSINPSPILSTSAGTLFWLCCLRVDV
jgi:hypothetical protein